MAREDTAGVILPPPIILLLALALGVGLEWISDWPLFQRGASTVLLGGALVAVSIALAAWSVRTMRLSGTRYETSQPTSSIVAHGPYQYTRNPIYLAMIGFLLGFGIALDSGWLLLTLIPFSLAIRYGVIAREERYLEKKFGADYVAYKKAVRRWL